MNKAKCIQLIHIAANQFKQDDLERRMIMLELTGKNSTKKMSLDELNEVLAYYKDMGFKVVASNKRKLKPRLAKLFSLWQEMADAGLIKNRSFKALETWAVKNCKGANFDRAIDKLDWFNDKMLNAAIEQLKAWRNRLEQPQSQVSA
ncbi:GemA protein [Thalassotalea loyana]|uniref:GemA protein n=1 Tax=Thalassotalea loyana TaxID=280483 RepID=A0ABQ6HHR6_9GAMM|nr:regulatory protein GemA [Thalassotalea loyana]GLX86335.1 GemA protein [Thalassotalea loyana]